MAIDLTESNTLRLSVPSQRWFFSKRTLGPHVGVEPGTTSKGLSKVLQQTFLFNSKFLSVKTQADCLSFLLVISGMGRVENRRMVLCGFPSWVYSHPILSTIASHIVLLSKI